MCGIAGIALQDAGSPGAGSPPEGALEAMLRTLAHRGPDGEGTFRAPGLALGHRRLAVIDPAGGAQPMATRSGRLCVSFNGEIYNHALLRKELDVRGHRFETQSDTEVLLHGYAAWGEEVVDRLRGMFAFAIWDARDSQLLLARDPLGQKPLYYALLADGSLVFASEAAALMQHPELRPAVDPAALAAYLTYEYLPEDLCMFAGIRKLRPGHVMSFRKGVVSRQRYYRIPMDTPEPTGDLESQLVAHVDAAVERCLMSDVPLGIFLSGGIDSSSILASAARLRDAHSLQTFSIGFEDPSFDESGAARRVARHFGTRHHERVFSEKELLDRIPRVAESLDEPLGDPSYLPTHLLCEFARSEVTVALGGDGCDELLCGYAPFRAESAARLFRRAPRPVRDLFRAAVERLPVGGGYMSADFVALRFASAADAPPEERHPRWLASALPGSTEDPLHPELRASFPAAQVLQPSVDAYLDARRGEHLQCVSYQYASTYLPDDILCKTDRASMASSLEVRAPFLERELVAFLASLPVGQKLGRRGDTKALLRRAMRPRLPEEVLKRGKHGFGIPIASWLRGPLRDLSASLLARHRLSEAGYFDPDVVHRLRRDHEQGRRDHRKILWTLLAFELWRDRHGVPGR